MSDPVQDKTNFFDLCPADGQALDSLFEEGWQVDGNDKDNPRSSHLRSLLNLLGQYPVATPPLDLLQRTLAAVEHARQKEQFAQQIHALRAPGVPFQWRELMTVAAMVMIGISLLWPALANTRIQARKVACASQLAGAGVAFGEYAQDHRDAMPRERIRPGDVWYKVGEQSPPHTAVRSNSAHLFILIRRGYLKADQLACPDNHFAPQTISLDLTDWPNAKAVSYSYLNQYGPRTIRLSVISQSAVLADKNPLFMINSDRQTLTFRDDLKPTTATSFHESTGQNVLLGSGEVTWTAQPLLNRENSQDNIWTIEGVKQYSGSEVPLNPSDAFLVP